VVILTRNSALEFLGEVTVAPVTSTIRNIPTEVVLGRADGMFHDCAITTESCPDGLAGQDCRSHHGLVPREAGVCPRHAPLRARLSL